MALVKRDWAPPFEIIRPMKIGELQDTQRFKGTKCLTCRKSMLRHWILVFSEKKDYGKYYCYRDGTSFSTKWGR